MCFISHHSHSQMFYVDYYTSYDKQLNVTNFAMENVKFEEKVKRISSQTTEKQLIHLKQAFKVLSVDFHM